MPETITPETPLLLPSPSDDDAVKIDVENEAAKFKLDALGPMVVNSDGVRGGHRVWKG